MSAGDAGTKRCTACGETKSLSDFGTRWNGKGPREKKYPRGQCKKCRTRLLKKETKPRLRRNVRTVIAEKKNVPCADCGNRYPVYVMEFDHVEPGTKRFGIGSGGRVGGVKGILEEIAKCEVVCANCHRIRTFVRMGKL